MRSTLFLFKGVGVFCLLIYVFANYTLLYSFLLEL